MPIRVRIERVGIYKQYPDKVIYDFEIERLDEIVEICGYQHRKYIIDGSKEFWHCIGAGIEKLVKEGIDLMKEAK